MDDRLTVLVANPSADVYGSDLQMLESVSAMVDEGWRVVVAMPEVGPLHPLLRERGAEIVLVHVPVVRRANLRPASFIRLALDALRSVPRMWRVMHTVKPDLLYVNTITIPWWLLVATLRRVPRLCHVHEAESKDSRLLLTALNTPMLLATAVVANSQASVRAMMSTTRVLKKKIKVIYNGVAGPDEPTTPVDWSHRPVQLLVVSRISPRKAIDVALSATQLLLDRGVDVALEVCGTPFSGYEWYEDRLRERANEAPLHGRVTFTGYADPVWAAYSRASILLAPSSRESFGNVVVEAALSGRAVVASAAMGHLEIVDADVTGVLVRPDDPSAMADAVEGLIANPERAMRISEAARKSAEERFSIGRYRQQIAQLVFDLAT